MLKNKLWNEGFISVNVKIQRKIRIEIGIWYEILIHESEVDSKKIKETLNKLGKNRVLTQLIKVV